MARLAERTVITAPRGYRSGEAALSAAQLEDLLRLMRKDVRGLTARELEWQPAAGMNSIGMLLAHIAIVEEGGVENAVRGVPGPEVEFVRLVGIRDSDDGMPAAAKSGHPEALRRKPLTFYSRLLSRGRKNLLAAIRPLTARDLARVRTRTRRDGKKHEYNVSWVLYHLVEHLA